MGQEFGFFHFTPPTTGQILWKYLDLHKFIYLLTEQKLFFTRLDKFNDPFEGVATRILRENNHYSKIPSKRSDFPSEMSSIVREQLLNEKKLFEFIKNDETEKAQKCQYVSCWHSSSRESMAMWNLYSNPDSVALKIAFDDLQTALTPSFKKFISDNGNRVKIIGSSVDYLPLNPFDPTLPKQKIKYRALKKDLSFEYEKEYRFLIITIDKLDRVPVSYTIPIRLADLTMTVVTHPNLELWKHKNLQKLLKLFKSNLTLEKSPIILK